MMKVDASQPLSMADDNDAFNIEQDQGENEGYFKELWRSFHFIYLKHKSFDEDHWQLAFCSSSFHFINEYPNIFLIYRILLFTITLFDIIYGIVNTNPVYEWPIYYTHLTLFVTFIAISFQFLTTCRIKFYRGEEIVPRHALQYIHIIFVLVSLGSGLAVCVLYWTIIYRPSARLYYPRIILDHGVLWFLLVIDIFLFTRLPVYMIDCIPFIIFAVIYGIFTILVFLFKLSFSNDRIGYVYRVFDFNTSPLRVTILISSFIFIMPVGIMFILWNLFRLRRTIHAKITNRREELNLNECA